MTNAIGLLESKVEENKKRISSIISKMTQKSETSAVMWMDIIANLKKENEELLTAIEILSKI